MTSLFVETFIVAYFVAVNTFYALLLVLAFFEIRRRKAERLPELDASLLGHRAVPPITTIVPAYNEKQTIVDSVETLLNVDYPNHEVVVVNDGSTDGTLERLADHFDLESSRRVVQEQLETEPVHEVYESPDHSELVVVDKENGGKGDAVNTGINVARSPLVCCLDADTLMARGALMRMVEPFVYDPRDVAAVGGTVRLANGCELDDRTVTEFNLPDSWLARFQIIEYLRSFLFGRIGLNRLGGNLIVSGAFGLFSKRAVVEVGGYDRNNITEDLELVMRLRDWGKRRDPQKHVVQIPDPTSFTQAPEEFAGLRSQRERWHRGLAQSLWTHRSMIFNPKLGALGMIVVPSYLIFELLGPFVELFGYGWFAASALFGTVSWQFALLFVVLAFLWGAILSIQSLVLDHWSFGIFRGGETRLPLVLAAILENLGYRQLTLLYRLEGFVKFFFGRTDWGQIARKQFRGGESEKRRRLETDSDARIIDDVPHASPSDADDERERRAERSAVVDTNEDSETQKGS